jgi:hypothetical protein
MATRNRTTPKNRTGSAVVSVPNLRDQLNRSIKFAEERLEDIQTRIYRARHLLKAFAGTLENARLVGIDAHPVDVCIGIADLLAAIESQIDFAINEMGAQPQRT